MYKAKTTPPGEASPNGMMIVPFGATLLKCTLTDQLVADFNEAIDSAIDNGNEIDWSHQLVGKVKQEIKIPEDAWMKHVEPLAWIVHNYVEWNINRNKAYHPNPKMDNTNPEFRVHPTSYWAVRSIAGSFNPVHMHTSCDISCIGYLQLPEWEEEIKEDYEDHYPCKGDLEFIAGVPLPFSNHRLKIQPKVGDFYVFPSWLMHTVYPFLESTGERRSFSVNWSVGKTPESGISQRVIT